MNIFFEIFEIFQALRIISRNSGKEEGGEREGEKKSKARMAETSGEMRGERQVNIAGDGEPAHQIVESDRDRGEDRDTEQAIEMRTARDAKAVPSSGGRNDPLESHLTGEQLANLTLEDHLLLERRIKVAHTNLYQKNAQKKKTDI